MGQDFLGQINIILSNKLYFSATILKDKCYHFPYKFLFSLKNLRLELTILKTPIDFLGINCHSILKVKISNYTKLYLLIKKKKKNTILIFLLGTKQTTLQQDVTPLSVQTFFFFLITCNQSKLFLRHLPTIQVQQIKLFTQKM